MTIHVLPIGDLIDHESEGDECVCGPTPEPVKRDDGSVGWLVTHHSLDGREDAGGRAMTTREARTLLATLPLAAHALIRAVCAALGHHKEPTRVGALTRCRYCRTLWIETR